MSNKTVTYRAHLISLDTAGAKYRWTNGIHETVTLHVDADRFKSMGRPGWVEVAVTPIGGVA